MATVKCANPKCEKQSEINVIQVIEIQIDFAIKQEILLC